MVILSSSRRRSNILSRLDKVTVFVQTIAEGILIIRIVVDIVFVVLPRVAFTPSLHYSS